MNDIITVFNPYLEQVVLFGLLIGLIGSSVSFLLGYFVSSVLHTFNKVT